MSEQAGRPPHRGSSRMIAPSGGAPRRTGPVAVNCSPTSPRERRRRPTGATAAPPGRGRTARPAAPPRPARSTARRGRGRGGATVQHVAQPRRALAARGALAARLARVEVEQRARPTSRTDTAASSATIPPVPGLTVPPGLSGSSSWAGGTRTPDGPPTSDRLQRRRRRHAAAELRRRASRSVTPISTSTMPGRASWPDEAEALGAVAAAECRPPAPPRPTISGHGEQRLHVVDDGGPAPEPGLHGERRLGPRHGAATLDRLHERRLLAEDEAAGAAAHLDLHREVAAEHVRGPRAPSCARSVHRRGSAARPTRFASPWT